MEIHHLPDPTKTKLTSKSIERRITIRGKYRSSNRSIRSSNHYIIPNDINDLYQNRVPNLKEYSNIAVVNLLHSYFSSTKGNFTNIIKILNLPIL